MNEHIDLKSMSLVELKGLAYDFLVQKEQAIINIQTVQNEIVVREQKKASEYDNVPEDESKQ